MDRDLVDALAENRAIVRWLSRRLADAHGSATMRRSYFEHLTCALGGHLGALEEVVFRALKAHGWRGISSSTLVIHSRLKRELAGLLALDPRSADFPARLHDLLALVDEHQGVEQERLVPALQKLLGQEESRALGSQVVARFSALYEPRLDGHPHAGPRELIDEARVVLSSLPRAPANEPASTPPSP